MTGPDVTQDAEPARPALRVLTPDATAEEIAALVAVLAAAGTGGPPPPRRRPEWASPARRMRPALRPGVGAWRGSGLPGG